MYKDEIETLTNIADQNNSFAMGNNYHTLTIWYCGGGGPKFIRIGPWVYKSPNW